MIAIGKAARGAVLGTARSAVRDAAGLLAMLLVLAGSVLGGWGPAAAQQLQPIPPFTARVIDRTGTLTAAGRQALEDELAAFERRKGSQIAVLIVPTTQPEAIEQYSIRVAEAWKIGRDRVRASSGAGARTGAIDDGVLLLVAKDDRRMRIEVGYGLEGAIPDGIARRIIDQAIAPKFRQQDWQGGIAAGLAELQRRIDGENLPAPESPAGGSGSLEDQLTGVLPILLFGFVAGSILSAIIGRFFGSAIASVGTGFFGASALGSMTIGVAMGAGVFLLLLMLGGSRQRLHRVGRRTYHDGPVILPGPWGGGGGGGGFGGGGGGFGGGGGGSFGGGGASGDW